MKKILILLFILFVNIFVYADQYTLEQEIKKLKRSSGTLSLELTNEINNRISADNILWSSMTVLDNKKVNRSGDTMTDWLHFSTTATISGKDNNNAEWNFQLSTVTATQSILETYSNIELSPQQNSLILDTTEEFALGTPNNTEIIINSSGLLRLAKTNTTTLITDFNLNTSDHDVTGQVSATPGAAYFYGDIFNGINEYTLNYEYANWWHFGSTYYASSGISRQVFNSSEYFQRVEIAILAQNITRFTLGEGTDTNLDAYVNYTPNTTYLFWFWKEGVSGSTNFQTSLSSIAFTTYSMQQYGVNLEKTGNIVKAKNNTWLETYYTTTLGNNDTITYSKWTMWNDKYVAVGIWREQSAGYQSTGTYNYVYDSNSEDTQWNNFVSSHSNVTINYNIHYRFRTSADNSNWTDWSGSMNLEGDFTYDISTITTRGRYIEVEATFHSIDSQNTSYISTMYFQYQITNPDKIIRYIAQEVQTTGNIKANGYKIYASTGIFSGNIGIGITNPTEKLVVNGNINISSMTIATTNLITNLNSDRLDNQHGSYYAIYNDVQLSTTTLRTDITSLQISTGTIMSNFDNYLSLSDINKILISDYGEVLISDNGNVLMNE